MEKESLINRFAIGINSGIIPVGQATTFLAGYKIDDSAVVIDMQGIIHGMEFPLTVNYNKVPEQMMKDNNYDKIGKKVRNNFFLSQTETHAGIVNLRAKLFNFCISVEPDAVFKAIKKAHYRVADIIELMAFDESCPEMRGTVIPLGDCFRNLLDTYYPYSFNNGKTRELSSDTMPRFGWTDGVYFLAIRE